jgi:hypothetical protein
MKRLLYSFLGTLTLSACFTYSPHANTEFKTAAYSLGVYIPSGFFKFKSDTAFTAYTKSGSFFKYAPDTSLQLIVWIGYKNSNGVVDVNKNAMTYGPNDLQGLRMMDPKAAIVERAINGHKWLHSRYRLVRPDYQNDELTTYCKGYEVMVVFHNFNASKAANSYSAMRDSIFNSVSFD